ncbi:integrase catalytic subunit [Mycobacterium tuberculosis]|nr:integrase catalytic subunit [Mycobacterium tuberculosis]
MSNEVNHLQIAPGGGEQLLNQEQWAMVKALAKMGYKIRKIARELDIDRNTVRKILHQEKYEPYQRKTKKPSVLEAFITFIYDRAPQVDFNAARIYEELKPKGYTGGYSLVKLAVRPLREAAISAAAATIRFETPPGKQAQMDWGSTLTIIGGKPKRIHIFVLVLGYSRALYVEFVADEKLPNLMACHEHAFEWFAGLTEEILYDNPKTIVEKRDNGVVVFNPKFQDFARYYGFNIRLCQPYRARTKGKIEAGVKYVKRSFVLGREFSSLEEANEQVRHWIRHIADQRNHGTTHQRPVDRLTEENLRLIGTRPPFIIQSSYLRKVPADCLVSFETNRYSVPWQYVNREVEIQPGPNNVLRIYYDGSLIAQHLRVNDKHKVIIEREHYRNILKQPETNPLSRFSSINPDVEIRNLSVYEELGGEVHGQ